MKEVLTKKFWEGVKKTFYEAMEESPTSADKVSTLPAAVEGKPKESFPSESSPSPPAPSEQS